MMYVDFNADNKDYKLILDTRNIVLLEKHLGCNPLMIFGGIKGDCIPTITAMVAILHASVQKYHHGITLNDAYDIFEKWLDEGHATTDFVSIIMDIYKASGIVSKDIEDNAEVKND